MVKGHFWAFLGSIPPFWGGSSASLEMGGGLKRGPPMDLTRFWHFGGRPQTGKSHVRSLVD